VEKKEGVVDIVTEKKVRIAEVIDAIKNNKCLEIFGTGTAVTAVPIKKLMYQEVEHHTPISEEEPGKAFQYIYNRLIEQQYGEVKSDLQYIVE